MSEFEYDLPESAIAQVPVEPRDSSRLLHVPNGSEVNHLRVSDLPGLIREGDVVVLNETRVLAARLKAKKSTGGNVEVFLLEPLGDGSWSALVKPSRRIANGARLSTNCNRAMITVGRSCGDGMRRVELMVDGVPVGDLATAHLLDGIGETPLPPYIRQQLEDADRYQTVFATIPGSVAAPTAGLHITRDLLGQIRDAGAEVHTVELIVGLDTFRPVLVDDTSDHVMHTEFYDVPPSTMEACLSAGRVIAVGTTTVRALESASLAGLSGRTDLFITRGYEWNIVDAMITNFHMPRSTLLVMVDAFVGPRWKQLYQSAITDGYRMLSFGDAMFLERPMFLERSDGCHGSPTC